MKNVKIKMSLENGHQETAVIKRVKDCSALLDHEIWRKFFPENPIAFIDSGNKQKEFKGFVTSAHTQMEAVITIL